MSSLLCSLLLCLTAVDADQDAVKQETAKLEGTWQMESMLQDGEAKIPEEDIKAMILINKGDKRTLKLGDNVISEATYKIDPKASPKTIDVTVTEGSLKGRTVYGIYELDGDTLKICLALEGKDRPKELTSKEGTNTLSQVLKRKKDAK